MTMRHGGEKRGNSRNRRARKEWMLSQPQWGGDGFTVSCQLHVSDSCYQTLTFATVEADRKVPGGPYRRDNIQPACPPCNKVKSNHWITP